MSSPGSRTPPKLANFQLALAALRRFVAEPQRSEAVEAGIIQAFEFTFEQAWKALQAIARGEGFDATSPRTSIGAGLKLSLVEDEQLWLDMLASRNLAAHTYHAELARELVEQIEQRYLGAFVKLRESLERTVPDG